MVTRSMDEVRADYISAMGQELGANFYELYRELVELHVLCSSIGSFSEIQRIRFNCSIERLVYSLKSCKTSFG